MGAKTTFAGLPQRQLMCARRREEPAAVVVIPLPFRARKAVEPLLRQFRVSDAADCVRHGAGFLVRAVLDERRLSRPGVERRLRAAVEVPLSFGWARFPDDGSSFEVLVGAALDSVAGPTYLPHAVESAPEAIS
jgi:hypothetical protein